MSAEPGGVWEMVYGPYAPGDPRFFDDLADCTSNPPEVPAAEPEPHTGAEVLELGGRPRFYVAQCSCGWSSAMCSSSGIARERLGEHLEAAT